MPTAVHYVPIITTLVAFPFAWTVYRHWRRRGGGPHLAWWAAGIFLYGVGTLTEASTTLFGWQPWLFKAWYVSGALLGAAPLAQGTVYLLMKRSTADLLTGLLIPFIAVAALLVALSPIDYALVEPHRLTGRVLGWPWVRSFTPFVNLYAFVFLVGGAAWSAWRIRSRPALRNRFLGNVLIAVGALLPGIGGTATRFGHTEVLYVTELAGLLLIWSGYRVAVRRSAAEAEAHEAGDLARAAA